MNDQRRASDPATNRIDLEATHTIAMAQGVLAERYRLNLDQALALLDQHALRSGLPIVEAARRLLADGSLP
ncbi:ANTAR domain-containing protein [Kribbella sp. CA-293567]|uniref:ANTAR domain-containing protein n=1 Tax=Kribbella sp. CA-293567 TaxID=3002436 RepID=UPI0022DD511B|nr:ANTAR domain-containing protein [Kribbella sp. CA-293567]WBQ03495.1 ANTAR domain-containing protein [Kribbella sp. CA-293567]